MPALTRRYNLYGRGFEPRITSRFTLRPLREQKFIFEIDFRFLYNENNFETADPKVASVIASLKWFSVATLRKKWEKEFLKIFFHFWAFWYFQNDLIWNFVHLKIIAPFLKGAFLTQQRLWVKNLAFGSISFVPLWRGAATFDPKPFQRVATLWSMNLCFRVS